MTGFRTTPIPGKDLQIEKRPGHRLLARFGKRVLRPGGRQPTNCMIEALYIPPRDAVIDFAPSLGETMRLKLACKPVSDTAGERDNDVVVLAQRFLQGQEQRCVIELAKATKAMDASATVVYGEVLDADPRSGDHLSAP